MDSNTFLATDYFCDCRRQDMHCEDMALPDITAARTYRPRRLLQAKSSRSNLRMTLSAPALLDVLL
jgi:hypothetical protein